MLIAAFFIVIKGIPINLQLAGITFLPIVTETYWYMTAYFIVYFLSPLINCGKKASNIVLYGSGICILFIVSVILTTSGNIKD